MGGGFDPHINMERKAVQLAVATFLLLFYFLSKVFSFLTRLSSLLGPSGFCHLALPVGVCSLECNDDDNQIVGEPVVLGERWHHSGSIHQDKGGHYMPHNMRSLMGNSYLGGTVLSSFSCKVDRSCLSALPSRPDNYYRVVSSFLGVQSSSCRANAKLPLCVSPIIDSVAWKEDSVRHIWDDLNIYVFLHLLS